MKNCDPFVFGPVPVSCPLNADVQNYIITILSLLLHIIFNSESNTTEQQMTGRMKGSPRRQSRQEVSLLLSKALCRLHLASRQRRKGDRVAKHGTFFQNVKTSLEDVKDVLTFTTRIFYHYKSTSLHRFRSIPCVMQY